MRGFVVLGLRVGVLLGLGSRVVQLSRLRGRCDRAHGLLLRNFDLCRCSPTPEIPNPQPKPTKQNELLSHGPFEASAAIDVPSCS